MDGVSSPQPIAALGQGQQGSSQRQERGEGSDLQSQGARDPRVGLSWGQSRALKPSLASPWNGQEVQALSSCARCQLL